MKKNESSFILLFKNKSPIDLVREENVEEIKSSNTENIVNENEWHQEYEVIYQSYSLE